MVYGGENLGETLRRSILAALGIVVTLLPAAGAQIVASGADQPQELVSPVEIEVPIDVLLSHDTLTTSALSSYVCDSSSIESLAIIRKDGKRDVYLTIRVAVQTRSPHDKRVTLDFRLGSGALEIPLERSLPGDSHAVRSLGYVRFVRLVVDAEEGEVKDGHVRARVDREAFERVLSSPNPVLKIRMTVVDH